MKFPKSKYPGIRQRGVNSWEIYYSKDGKKTTENFKGSEIEASIRRSQLILGAGSSVPSKSEDITFEQAFKSYTNVKSKLLDENTIQRSTCIFNHFVDYLSRVYPGVRFVAQVTPEIGTHYKNYMISDTNKRPSGINTDITKLRAIFTVFMSECFIIPSNPFKKVSKIPRREAKPKEKHLPTNQEVIILLNDFKNDVSYCEITRFLLRVGRRIEEVTEYLKKDVVFDPAGRPICVNGLALYYPDGRPIALKVRKEITKTDESGNILLPFTHNHFH